MRPLLVLFDIDMTLVKGSKVHREAFGHAFRKVYGVEANIGSIDAGGMTDRQMIGEALEKSGMGRAEIDGKIEGCIGEISKFYETNCERDDGLQALPGANELIEALEKRGVPIGLLTGNIESIARRKLRMAGIRKAFEIGGFGGDSAVRAELVARAIGEAEKRTGVRYSPAQVVLVGDTPRDVAGAKGAGARIIAVASGRFGKAELESAGADYVIGSLLEKERFFEILEKMGKE